MDPFKGMRDAGAHARIATDAGGVVAKAARARRARWEHENKLARRREAAPVHADLAAVDTTGEWPAFVLIIALFLTFVVVAAMVVSRI
jgi:hypothetical protein